MDRLKDKRTDKTSVKGQLPESQNAQVDPEKGWEKTKKYKIERVNFDNITEENRFKSLGQKSPHNLPSHNKIKNNF